MRLPNSKCSLMLCLGFLLAFVSLPGCGGGSVGTGVSKDRRSFEGRTISTDARPVVGARVTLLDTGESTATDEDGRFYLPSNFDGPVANLEVHADPFRKTFPIPNSNQQTSGTQLTIVVNPNADTASIRDLEVSVQVRGPCDYYFENTRTIRQANDLDDGTLCSLRVEIRSGGKPLEDAPFLLQRRRCLDGAPWHQESVGSTASSQVDPNPVNSADLGKPPHPGVARLPFLFCNEEAHCVYRIVAPNIPGIDPVLYEIHTFRKQQFDKEAVRK